MQEQNQDENGQPMNAFEEILKVSDTELLMRFRHRLNKVGRKKMVQILSEEIERRELEEHAEAKKRRAA